MHTVTCSAAYSTPPGDCVCQVGYRAHLDVRCEEAALLALQELPHRACTAAIHVDLVKQLEAGACGAAVCLS